MRNHARTLDAFGELDGIAFHDVRRRRLLSLLPEDAGAYVSIICGCVEQKRMLQNRNDLLLPPSGSVESWNCDYAAAPHRRRAHGRGNFVPFNDRKPLMRFHWLKPRWPALRLRPEGAELR